MTERFKSVVERWYAYAFHYDIKDVKDFNRVVDDVTLSDLWANSLDEIILLTEIEEEYKINIPLSDMLKIDFTHMRFGDMCDYVESKCKNKENV
jgi:acyl carrier protein